MSTLCNVLLPIVVVVLILTPHSISADGPTQALIDRICRETDDMGYCRDVFNRHLPGGTADAKRLTQVAITQTLIYATDTRISLQKADAKESNREIKNSYQICIVGYGFVMNLFEDATLAFAKGNYRAVVFDVEKCDRFVSDCQNVLWGLVASVKDMNAHAKVLVKMSLVSGGLIGR